MTYCRNIGLCITLLWFCACTSLENEKQTLEENKLFVKRYFEEIFNTGDTSRIMEFVSPEYTEVYMGQRYPIGIQGAIDHVKGVRAVYEDFQLVIGNQIAEGDWVVSIVTVTGRHTGEWIDIAPTNKIVEIDAINVNKVVKGKIVEHKGAANILIPFLKMGAIQPVK